MTTSRSVEHTTRRFLIDLPGEHDDLVGHLERVVPAIDLDEFVALGTWQEHLDLMSRRAPHGFLRYYGGDVGAVLATSPARWRASQYLVGNHTIAEQMYRHDPTAMLHAPLRMLLYVGPEGTTSLAVDQPSLLFSSYGDPDIASVGRYLDSQLAGLVTTLGGDPPAELLEGA